MITAPSVLLSAPNEYYKYVVTFIHATYPRVSTVTIWAISYNEALLWALAHENEICTVSTIEGSF